MRPAYKRRPQDFKRRILTLVFDRKLLFSEEQRWLNYIPKEQLGKRYYNLSTGSAPRWQLDDQQKKTVSEKISATLKAKHLNDPEYRARFLESGSKNSAAHLQTPEVIAKRAATRRAKTPDDQRYVPAPRGSEELKQKLSAASKKRWAQPGAKEKQSKISSELNKGKQRRLGQKNTPEHTAKIAESNRGKKRSEESRRKMSEAARGRRATPEQRAARSERTKEMWRLRKEAQAAK